MWTLASLLPGGAHEDPDVAIASAFITLTESSLLQQVDQASSLDLYHQIALLGKTEIYDVNLSPLKNIACATCHVPYTGFRGSAWRDSNHQCNSARTELPHQCKKSPKLCVRRLRPNPAL
jgi:cytochrome c peroxidase